MSNVDISRIPPDPLTRQVSSLCDFSEVPSSFALGASHKSYKQQFANLYFVRLRLLRKAVEQNAWSRWKDVDGTPTLVPRVLEVVKNQTCFIVGTVYMEMPLKPNVLEDVTRDRSIPAPPPREKICSPDDAIMLEDESGRIQLVGDVVRRQLEEESSEYSSGSLASLLVTGVIMAALGRETAAGEFQVLDVCFAGMAPMLLKSPGPEEDSMVVDGAEASGDDWVALLSGLEISSSSEGEPSEMQLRMQMLVEYLSCEAGGADDQVAASRVSRIFIAGNSLAPSDTTHSQSSAPNTEPEKRAKRFGQDASTYSSGPTQALGSFMQDLAELMPVHLLPGPSDPLGSLIPQQPFPRGMFGALKENKNLTCETNPAWVALDSVHPNAKPEADRPRSILLHSGQPIDDMYKYVPNSNSEVRLHLTCASVQWRHMAPTAPDTLWCYPYFDTDPFALKGTPDILVVGCQPSFATRLLKKSDEKEGEEESEEENGACRVVLVPKFSESGTVVLVNLRNLDVKTVTFGTKIS